MHELVHGAYSIHGLGDRGERRRADDRIQQFFDPLLPPVAADKARAAIALRQDFTWRRIERRKGEYNWEAYDRLVEKCLAKGLLLFGLCPFR